MSYVDDFLKAQARLEKLRQEQYEMQQEAVVQRQRAWDRRPNFLVRWWKSISWRKLELYRLHLNGTQLLKIFLVCAFWAGLIGLAVYKVFELGAR